MGKRYHVVNLISQLVMEYCDLGSVRDLLLFFEENVPKEYISVISRSVLLGLKSLHDQQKIHRDIKTENILLLPL